MLIPLAGVLLGAVIGATTARMQGGKAADMAQWGAVFALILGLVGVFVTLVLIRTAG